jgi:transposase, IS5 family
VKIAGMMTDKPRRSSEGVPLEVLLDRTHPLVKLSDGIDWSQFTQAFGPLYAEEGRPGVPVRVMVGLHYLKHLFNESDESVVLKWVENPYWQYLCGCETFQHELPCHPSSLVKWRKRIGVEGMEQLLKGVLNTALKVEALPVESIKQVTVDTTVQEKAIAFPTDARLYHKARRALVRAAKAEDLKLRQTYARASRKALFQQSRYAAAQQHKRATRETRKLRVMLGRVIRDVHRKQATQTSAKLERVLAIAERIHTQQRHDSPKLYSVHAPEVECIAKGKVHKRYEFGCKVALAVTSEDNWIVGVQAHHDNPYDGQTLEPALAQVARLTSVQPRQALVDQGFRGAKHHPKSVEVLVVGARKVAEGVRAFFKRRSAIEPVIGHTKHDHGMVRNFLLGKAGDSMNAVLTACGFNLAKLMRFFAQAQPTWHCAV